MYDDILLWDYGLRVVSTERRMSHDVPSNGLRYFDDPVPYLDYSVKYQVVHNVEVDAEALVRLSNILAASKKEKMIREENPALKKAYDNYKLLLAMVDQNVKAD